MHGPDELDDEQPLRRTPKGNLRLIYPTHSERDARWAAGSGRRRWYVRVPWWLFAVVVLAGFLFLLEATVDRPIKAPVAGASRSNNEEVSRGAGLYVEYACVQCHGLGGKGRSALQISGTSLVSTEFRRAFPLDAAVVDVIKNGSIAKGDRATSMPAWNGILPDEDIRAIAAYIRSGLPEMGVPLPPISSGEEIYRAFACVKCHGPLGTGGIKNVAATDPAHQVIPALGGPEFRRKYDGPDKVRRVLLSGKLVEGGRTGVVYAPAWGKIGTAEEIEKVIEYLYSY